jgi:RecA-family ATPase
MGEALPINTPAQIAADLARAGFPVFPCGHDKRPLTPHGFKDATAELGEVEAYWRQYPSALVGLPTGATTRIFVIDLDTDKTTGEPVGENSLAALGFADLKDRVPSVQTPSGGLHLYFRAAGLPNTVRKLGAGIDTRGEGGYVIAPGSIGPAGAYVARGVQICQANLPDLPRPLLDALRVQAKPALQVGASMGLRRGSDTPAALCEVQEVLSYIPPDCSYGDWVTVLMGLHDHFDGSKAGLDVADEWSAGGVKYKLGEVAEKWRGFKAGGGTGWGSVCSLARQCGADLSAIARSHKGKETPFAMQTRPALEAPNAEPTRDMGFFCAADLSGKAVPERAYLVAELVPAGTVTTINGDGGTGKSLIALQLCVSTVLGRPWMGQKVKPGRALFISAEDDRDEIHRRLYNISCAEGVGLADLDNLTLCSLAGEDALLAVPTAGQGDVMQETPLFRALDEWLSKHRPTLTVLDTLADLFGGNEVNRAQARQFIGLLRGLALRHDTTVILLAHPSQSGMASGTGSSGSTAWNNSVRSRLYLRRIKSTEGDEPDADARELEVMKANYGRTGLVMPLRWKEGVFVLDARSETGLDRMVASAKAERVFLKILRAYTDEGRYVSAQPGPTFAPSAFAKHPHAEGCTNRALRAAMDSLLASGRIKIAMHGSGAKARSHIAIVQRNGD